MKRKQKSNPNYTYKGFKTELDPTQEQITYFKKSCGVARFVYNWALAFNQEEYERRMEDQQTHINERKTLGLPSYSEDELKTWQKMQHPYYVYPSHFNLLKIFNSIKYIDFPWIKDVSKCASHFSLIGLDSAFERFFKHASKFPQKKKKHKRDSFSVDCNIEISKTHVKLPKIGWVKLKEKNYLPIGKPKKITVSRKADRWLVSIYQEIEITKQKYNDEAIGVDLGIKTLATCSDGTEVEKCNKIDQKQKKLKRKQRKLARQKGGNGIKSSKGREKTKLQISKIHACIGNHRKDVLHKATTMLAKTKSAGVVVIEDLNIKGMLKNHKLARSIANIGAYEFRRQLEYKCLWYGKKLVVANKWFPSSKMCSCCGHVKDKLDLGIRVYHCKVCGMIINRDFNAAKNLADYPKKHANKYEAKSLENNSKDTGRYSGIKEAGVQLVGAGELNKQYRNEEVTLDLSENGKLRCSLTKPELIRKYEVELISTSYFRRV